MAACHGGRATLAAVSFQTIAGTNAPFQKGPGKTLNYPFCHKEKIKSLFIPKVAVVELVNFNFH